MCFNVAVIGNYAFTKPRAHQCDKVVVVVVARRRITHNLNAVVCSQFELCQLNSHKINLFFENNMQCVLRMHIECLHAPCMMNTQTLSAATDLPSYGGMANDTFSTLRLSTSAIATRKVYATVGAAASVC